MRSNRLCSVLVGFTAVAALAPDASAMYHPTLGRFLQRDPAGYADGMGLSEYARGDPASGLDPSGTCTCSEEEVKRRLLKKVKVAMDPATVQVTLYNKQDCETPDDIGELCTARVTYFLLPRALGWDPKGEPKTETRWTSVTQCSARIALVCHCTDYWLWEYYHWDDPSGPNPQVDEVRRFVVTDEYAVDEGKAIIKKWYEAILKKLSPGLGDLADPYGIAIKQITGGAVKASADPNVTGDPGVHTFTLEELPPLEPGEEAQKVCVGED